MRAFCVSLAVAMAMLLAGCETADFKQFQEDLWSLFQANKGEADLAAGVRAYENANYNESTKYFQSALEQGLGKADQVQAHKYLAFTYCVTGRQTQCRNEFRKALKVDPGFDLTAAEAGHPMWGPVFAKEKTRR